LADLLEEQYAAYVAALVPLAEAGEGIYRVERREGPPWVVRLFPKTRPPERVRGDAAVLRCVERHGVPAERLIAAADGAPTASLDGRGVLVTTYLAGRRPDRSPATLRALGEAVGRLHALPPVRADDPLLARRAGALPKEDLAYGYACLDRVAAAVPSELRREHDALRAALAATADGEDLPFGLIHSDAHLANAVQAADGGVALFDWDGAGQGPRAAALGWLLYTCAVGAPGDPPGPPDLGRVDAVLAGYLRWHTPGAAELARLPDMVRFRPLVIAAREFAASVERGQPPSQAAWWSGYGAAEAIAARARRVIERSRG
jgi:Ser/Thr protein kinase RdoA (MazF antagonist)